MRWLVNGFGRTQGYMALGLLVLFSGFTLFLVCQPKNKEGVAIIVGTTLATATGPMVGAVARNCQSCCLKFSLSLLPWSGAFLATGILFQFVPLPFQRFAKALRLTMWVLGLLGWFGGGVVSFAHAFS